MSKFQCDNCGFEDEEESLPEAKDILQRMTPGGLFTDRECPKCGALCFPVIEGKAKRWYTAILIYPDYASSDYGGEYFIDFAQEENGYKAAAEVQKKASAANGGHIKAEDFRLVAVFKGKITPALKTYDF